MNSYLLIFLIDSFYIKVYHIQAAGLLDVDAIKAVEGINDGLAAIGDDRVAHTLCCDLNRHARFDTDTVELLTAFRGNLEQCHIIGFRFNNRGMRIGVYSDLRGNV